MVIEFECRKCGLIVSYKEGNKNRYCPNCDMFLQIRRSPTWINDKEQQSKSWNTSKNLGIPSLTINPKQGKEI